MLLFLQDFFHDYFIDSDQVFQLKGSADRALDALGEPIGDWAHVRPGCRIPWRVKTLQVFSDSRLPWLARWAHASLFRALERSATLALALCHAHAIALKDLQVSVLACRSVLQHMRTRSGFKKDIN